MNSHIEGMSSPSPLPRGGGANTDDVATPQARSSQPPAATPAPASTLNPFAPPYESAGAGSYRSVEPLPAWLQLSPSSSSDEDSAPPPMRGKGKAPMADPPLRAAAPSRHWSDFMAAARDAFQPRKPAVKSKVVRVWDSLPCPEEEGWQWSLARGRRRRRNQAKCRS
jgi:hypothetical protein